jgi:lactate racemase
MNTIDLKYGRRSITVEFDPYLFEVLAPDHNESPLTDGDVGRFLDEPIDSPPLDDIVNASDQVLLVVPDATRQSGCGQIVNLIVRRLIAAGSSPADINIIFATGIHRPVTDDEKIELLTPFIAQRIKTIDHIAADPIKNFRVGETAGGIPVELDWTLTEYDHIVIIGSVTFHYFAGFTGGRKLICPGLASARTIDETHKLAFDCETRNRRSGVTAAMLDGNPVHEVFVEAASKIPVAFAINTTVDDSGAITSVFCGDWIKSHQKACEHFARNHTLKIDRKRDLVIASCGGYPFDINLIQAHKTLDAAAAACNDGGTIILLAECIDGLGRTDFLDWFDASDSRALTEKLCERYQVNGQTAWSLLTKAERFDIKIVTSLDSNTVKTMRLDEIKVDDLIRELTNKHGGYIIPAGSKILINC